MVEVNLLPWRSELRKKRRVKIFLISGLILLMLLLIIVTLRITVKPKKHLVISQKIAVPRIKKFYQTIHTLSVKQLQVTGYASQEGRTWIFIRFPNQKVIMVKPGDEIGKEKLIVRGVVKGQLVFD